MARNVSFFSVFFVSKKSPNALAFRLFFMGRNFFLMQDLHSQLTGCSLALEVIVCIDQHFNTAVKLATGLCFVG